LLVSVLALPSLLNPVFVTVVTRSSLLSVHRFGFAMPGAFNFIKRRFKFILLRFITESFDS